VQVRDGDAELAIAHDDPSTALEVPPRRGVPRALDEPAEQLVGDIVRFEPAHGATRRHRFEQQGSVEVGGGRATRHQMFGTIVAMGSLHDPPLLPHLITQALHRFDDEPCVELGGATASYADVRRQTSCMVQAQRHVGLGRGSRIAVLSKNRPEVLSNIAATFVNGGVLTPLHPLGSAADHAYALHDSESDCLVFDGRYFSERAAALQAQFPELKLLSFGAADVGTDYLALCEKFEPGPLDPADVAPDDLATVVYTGGTTGKPKGVVMPHRVWATMTMIQIAEWEFPDPLRMLVATPLSHAAMSLLAPVVVKGGSFTVMEAFDPVEFLRIVERERITATMIVPVMLYAIQACSAYETADVSSLETVFYGASPMSPAKLEAAIDRWGPRFFQFYGQTEAPMVAAHMKKAEHDVSKPWRLASCGRPAPWIKLALLDERGEEVQQGEVGEICVRGPLVMTGYKDLVDETAAALAGDWLHTGDVGRFDEDGFLYIVDRTKDMIITGGFNVYPREVEDVLSAHPAVSVAMVIGVPDEKWGEAVKAVVVLRSGYEPSDDLTAELQSLVKAAKGSAHAPKTIDFATDIPLTPVGKPDKKQLRAAYWEATERAVG
jgi:fatty-acyl-CoA synthase